MLVPSELTLDTHLIGRRVLSFDRVDSTNSVAAGYASDLANDGLVIVAEDQTAGRGKRGSRWLSLPGDSLLLSVLLFPPEHLRRPAILTTLAAVAVCETIRQCTNLQADLKWPNDVLIQGRKVSGILVEQSRGIVIGIGLNVHTSAAVFDAAQLPQAGSLCMFAAGPLDRKRILQTLVRLLDSGYEELRQGRMTGLESLWRRYAGWVGRQIRVHSQESVYQGRCVDLTFDYILVEESLSKLWRLRPEAVDHIIVSDDLRPQ